MVKKGQVETMGLVVILILIVLIGLFFIKYSLKDDVVSEDPYLSLKANAFLNSLSQVSIADGDFNDLVVECCDNEPCESVKNNVTYYGEKYLDEEFYFFLDCGGGGIIKVPEEDPCFGVTSNIITFFGIDEMYVKICRKE